MENKIIEEFIAEIKKSIKYLDTKMGNHWQYVAHLGQNETFLWSILWPDNWGKNGMFTYIETDTTKIEIPMFYFFIAKSLDGPPKTEIYLQVISDNFVGSKINVLNDTLDQMKSIFQNRTGKIYSDLFDRIVDKMQSEVSFHSLAQKDISIKESEIIKFVTEYYTELNPLLS